MVPPAAEDLAGRDKEAGVLEAKESDLSKSRTSILNEMAADHAPNQMHQTRRFRCWNYWKFRDSFLRRASGVVALALPNSLSVAPGILSRSSVP